jgi:hypothetical protein
MNKPLSKEELIERLKAIATDDTPRIENPGAMCYSPMMPKHKKRGCDICGISILYFDYVASDSIFKTVREIRRLGYDVKVEAICKTCAEKLKKELYPNMKSIEDEDFDWEKDISLHDINFVFYFRITPDADYHRAISNRVYQYTALLTLLQNEPMYSGNYDESHYIADEIDSLEFMTGIKFNV